ncbi:methylguanine-DNA methyltransferase, truncated [Streptococcus thermophilus LMG 18311]|nr:methylguanine-DNA methyltransferase, truncated [Streptococcus thermophilus LMG 18311]
MKYLWGKSEPMVRLVRQSLVNPHRAVGTAVNKNPWLILIPCHRVLPSSGHLGNYAVGEDVKCFLLRLEGLRFDNP